jgi:hypothetical protein
MPPNTFITYSRGTPIFRKTGNNLTLSQLMLHICGVSKMFDEWYQKTNKTEDKNKLTLLAFKIIAILQAL